MLYQPTYSETQGGFNMYSQLCVLLACFKVNITIIIIPMGFKVCRARRIKCEQNRVFVVVTSNSAEAQQTLIFLLASYRFIIKISVHFVLYTFLFLLLRCVFEYMYTFSAFHYRRLKYMDRLFA